jgi:hypothetical protein
MIITRPPPAQLERWWISQSAPPPPGSGWRGIKPAELPADATPYLAAGVIVLDNIPADAVDRPQRGRIEQYVRDLGGGLVILGGERAYAAGGYAGTPLESVSPLASNPPEPTTHWVILCDSSGSMSAAIGDNTRWAFATNAVLQLLPLLPPDDPLTAGDFARARRWWCRDLSVSEAMQRRLLPRDVHPTGPTNLGPALRDVAESAGDGSRYVVIVVTDAQAQIDGAARLAEELAAKHVTVHVLSATPVPAQNDVRTVAERTAGSLLDEADPREWPARLRQIARAAAVPWLMRKDVQVEFTSSVPQLPPARASVWNRTWLKSGATTLAVARSSGGPDDAPDQRPLMIAGWNLGAGACVATTFQPPPELARLLADRVMVPPRDPRFTVTWDPGWPMRVMVDAVDDGRFMNELTPTLELAAEVASPARATPIPQVAPGRYELAISSFPRGGLASVFLGTSLLDRTVLPGRCAEEFARIGNDRAAMQRLAESTGGRVIEPTDVRPVEFRWPARELPLGPYLAITGGAALAAGLIRWRLG